MASPCGLLLLLLSSSLLSLLLVVCGPGRGACVCTCRVAGGLWAESPSRVTSLRCRVQASRVSSELAQAKESVASMHKKWQTAVKQRWVPVCIRRCFT
jgi:hypothetical protein